MKNIIKNTMLFIILLISFVLVFSINWIYSTYGNITLEEIMFQIRVPNTNANADYYYSYAINALSYIILCTVGSFFLISKLADRVKKYPKRMIGKHYEKSTSLIIYKNKWFDKRYVKKIIAVLMIFIISIMYSANKTDLKTYMEHQNAKSTLIEDEYVDAKNINIVFPEQKRNIIYIFLESMEATFYSREKGGMYDESLIEDLETLAEENIAFSNSEQFTGLYSLPGTGWTTGAMVAQNMGIPLKLPIEANSYGNFETFLPGAMRNRRNIKKTRI